MVVTALDRGGVFFKNYIIKITEPPLNLGGSYHLASGIRDIGRKSTYSCIYPGMR